MQWPITLHARLVSPGNSWSNRCAWPTVGCSSDVLYSFQSDAEYMGYRNQTLALDMWGIPIRRGQMEAW